MKEGRVHVEGNHSVFATVYRKKISLRKLRIYHVTEKNEDMNDIGKISKNKKKEKRKESKYE